MPNLWTAQICCISVTVISMLVMGTHLFVGDGVSNPSYVLTATAVLALAGLVGNAVCTFIRHEQKSKERNLPDDH